MIAYSTMSQIGYMIMGVSVGAYSAGLFHLMTHAFFKALLFMSAGSLISAMAGWQTLDRMSGFRKALPFTFVCFLVGGLALSGLPPFSGWLSKDDIIAFLDHRGGGFEILGVFGYIGALLTGIYTFRMIFRAFFGEPCEEARELEHGHLAHAAAPFNPATGEEEDTDVGFPGPDHHIAERELPMKLAMGTLAVLAVIGGIFQIPGVDASVSRFLAPTFADSRLTLAEPSTSAAWIGLVIGAAVAVLGITIAYRIWFVSPATATALQKRFAPLHTFLYQQVVLRRADRLHRRAPGPVGGEVRGVGAGANRRRGGDHRRRCGRCPRRLGRGAAAADRLRALLRRRDGDRHLRRRPLLPDLLELMACA